MTALKKPELVTVEEYLGFGEMISLAEIDCELSLADLYEGIVWG